MDYFVGEIRLFAGNYEPNGWRFCDGRTMPITGNELLFALIGTIYGGDGRTSFMLPDMRGRVPVGMGQGSGLTNRTLGQTGGAERVVLNAATIPAHSHNLMVSTTAATATTAEGNTFAMVPSTGTPRGLYLPTDKPGTAQQFADAALADAGYDFPHDNCMPTMAFNFIIAVSGGLFPQRP
jgi:Microcystin-dependent protein